MRVFICWSESRSRSLAEYLATWLPKVCDTDLTCCLSTQFQAGVPWLEQLLGELEKTDVAVICLTPENLDARWLHFEAGMVFGTRRDRVFPYFLGAEVPEIRGPLSVSQAKTTTASGTLQLAQALARVGSLDMAAVQRGFEQHWPELMRFLRGIAAPNMRDLIPELESLFERKTFTEPLDQCTDQSWITRYDGARVTLLAVEGHLGQVERCCQPWQLWLYRQLKSQLEGYVLDLRESLLIERRYTLTDQGRVDFTRPLKLPPGRPVESIAASCAHRCRQIRHAVFCLVDPTGSPRLEDALRFAKLSIDQFDDKKRLIHSKGMPVDRAALGIQSEEELESCLRSIWDFDRIIYYRVRREEPIAASRLAQCVENELHLVEAEGPGASKMPLHYAVRAWLSALEQAAREPPRDTAAARRVIDGVQIFLDRVAKPNDDDPKIRAHLAEIRTRLRQ